MGSILRAAARCSLTAWHKLAGWMRFRIGPIERSRRHFERVLELKGDDFTAYVYLGRLAQRRGDLDACRREYEHARRVAPERYARLEDSCPGPARHGTLVEETSERATWMLPRVSISERGRPDLRARASEDLSGCFDPGLLFFGDDFATEGEREKFRSLPPIRAEDLRAIDLDALARRLAR